MTVVLSALLGVALGPTLHHLAVKAGERRPFGGMAPLCPGCESPRRFPLWHSRRCPTCGTVGRRTETAVVVGSAAAFALAGLVAGPTWLLPAFLVFAAVSVVLVVTDVDHKLIPNRVLYPGGLLASGLLAAGAVLEGRARDLPVAAAGAAGYFGVLFVVALAARGGFGFGDVKLGALLGAFTAFEGVRVLLLGVFFTGLYGGLPAIVLLALRRAGRKDELPYGPAMVAGAWTALVVGDAFLRWYSG